MQHRKKAETKKSGGIIFPRACSVSALNAVLSDGFQQCKRADKLAGQGRVGAEGRREQLPRSPRCARGSLRTPDRASRMASAGLEKYLLDLRAHYVHLEASVFFPFVSLKYRGAAIFSSTPIAMNREQRSHQKTGNVQPAISPAH